MTTAHDIAGTADVPRFTQGHRMALALEQVGMNRTEMAQELGTTTEAIRRWTSGVTEPKRHVLIAWATVCGVNLGWLETGEPVEPVLRARRDSNPQPSDLEPAARPALRLVPGRPQPYPQVGGKPTLPPELALVGA